MVIGRLKDHKMRAKLQPILALEEVGEIALVRRTPLDLPGVRNYCPPPLIRDVSTVTGTFDVGLRSASSSAPSLLTAS